MLKLSWNLEVNDRQLLLAHGPGKMRAAVRRGFDLTEVACNIECIRNNSTEQQNIMQKFSCL